MTSIARALVLLAAPLTVLGAASCGSSDDGTPAPDGGTTNGTDAGDASLPPGADAGKTDSDAGTGSDAVADARSDGSAFACAPHAAIPEIKYWGGPILTAAEVVTITYDAMDPAVRKAVEDFGDTCTQTEWWDVTMKDYCDKNGKCIGHGKSGGHVVLNETPDAKVTYTDSQDPAGSRTIVKFIQDHIDSGQFPAPNDQTLYSIFFPQTVTITLDGTPSCQGFGGYHFAADLTPKGGGAIVRAAYAVMPSCRQGTPDVVTRSLIGVASHEYIEAATDAKSLGPEIRNADWGYYMEDPSWGILFSGQEVGDLCPYPSSKIGTQRVTRGWLRHPPACSNPCGPADPADLYFGAAPARQVIELAVGESADVEVVAFSEKPMADWEVSVDEPSRGAFGGTGYGGHLEVSLSGGTAVDGGASSNTVKVNNGTKLTMHVKLLSAPPEDANYPSQTNVRYHHVFASLDALLDANTGFSWPFTVRQKP